MKGLLGDAWDMVSGAWGGLLQTDPDLKARRDQEAKELYDRRAQSPFFQMFGWGEGNNERTEDFSFGNIGKDIGELYRGGATAVTNPAETTKAVSDLAFGGVLNLSPIGGLLGEVGKDQREIANEFGSYLKETYGSWDGFLSYAKKNPASAMLDLVGVGFVAKKVVDVATNPLVQQRFMAELDGIVSAAGQNPYMHNIVAPDKQFVSGTPVGSGAGKQTPTQVTRVNELQDIVTQIENSDIVQQPVKSFKDMDGEIIMFTMTDRARGGGTLKNIKTSDNQYDVDVGQYAGPLFGQMLKAIQQGDAWASDRVALGTMEKRLQEIHKLHDITPQVSQYILSPTGIHFSHQIAQTMLSALKPKLSAKEKINLDNKIRHIAPDWIGVDNDLELAMRGVNGEQGKKIAFILASNSKNPINVDWFKGYKGKDKTGYADQVPSIAETSVANTQPELLGARRGTIPMITTLDKNPNTRFNDADPSSINSEGKRILHPSYNATWKSDGNPTRPFKEDLTIYDVMEAREATGAVGFTGKDFIKPQKIDPANVTPDQHYATLRNQAPYVQVTDKLIRNLEEQGKLVKGGLLR